MHPLVLLFFAIASEVAATTALKATEGFTRLLPSLVVLLGYGLSFYLLSLSLRHISLGIAYAIWSGLGTTGVVLMGVLIWRESINWMGVLGIGLIISGVMILNLLGRTPTP